jgi:4a-hydroxytetrahydrobiopterin dehydratase
MKQPVSAIDPAEVAARLAVELPHWTYENGWIRRRIRTSGWKSTLMVINTVGHLAEAAWHHPDLAASYAFVVVKLQTHSAGGITELDFALARKIEEVVCWRPGNEGLFEGTPTDPRFRYIKYDAGEADETAD